jgi:hypothetical protein
MGLVAALAFGFLACEVGAGRWIDPAACDRDDVQSAVELAVASAVQAVAVMSAVRGGRLDRRRSNSLGADLTRWMLLCCQGRFGELVVEVSGEVSLEGSHGFSLGLSFVDAALDVGAAGWVVDGA